MIILDFGFLTYVIVNYRKKQILVVQTGNSIIIFAIKQHQCSPFFLEKKHLLNRLCSIIQGGQLWYATGFAMSKWKKTIQQGFEMHSLKECGPRRHTVFNWVEKHLRYKHRLWPRALQTHGFLCPKKIMLLYIKIEGSDIKLLGFKKPFYQTQITFSQFVMADPVCTILRYI